MVGPVPPGPPTGRHRPLVPREERSVVKRTSGRWRVVLGIVVLAVGTMGCTATQAAVPPATRRPPKRATRGAVEPSRATPATTLPATAAVGGTLTLSDGSGKALAVTVEHVVDPAQGANALATPQVGKRFVGVALRVLPTSGTADVDVNADTVVVGTDGRTYLHDDDPIVGCTAFTPGKDPLHAGTAATGCVTFQLPTGVQVGAVEFAPTAGGPAGRWQVG